LPIISGIQYTMRTRAENRYNF